MRVFVFVGLVALVRCGYEDALRITRATDDGGTKESDVPSVEWKGASPAPTTPANFSGLDTLLEVYNAERVAANWVADRVNVTPSCFRDMELMYRAAERGEIWAIKMRDATGRYSGGFLWGNNYWMGSSTQCNHLHVNVSTGNEIYHGLTPRINATFFVVTANVDTNGPVSLMRHGVNIGFCLPASCTKDDVKRILEYSRKTAPVETAINVISIRNPGHHYKLLEDPLVWSLIGVSVVVVALMVVATVMDVSLDRKKRFAYDNYSYNMSAPQLLGIRANGKPVDNSVSPTIDPVSGSTPSPNSGSPSLMASTCPTPTLASSASSESGLSQAENPPILQGNPVAQEPPFSLANYCKELLLSFSIRRNWNTIVDKSVGEDTISTIHGLRFISMGWVILGHTCIVAFKYSDNTAYRTLMEKEFFFQTINNGAFSVDTFFFISGLLVSFLYFRTTAKLDVDKITKTTGFSSNALQFIGLLFYRFFRLTAPYMFSMAVVQVQMTWFQNNSVFHPPTMDHINCPKYWWRNILYINTLFPVDEMCMLWSWYLADDTQFYILGLVLLILAANHFRLAAGTLVVFMVSSWFTTAYIAFSNKHMPSVDDPLALFDKIYDKPWTRLGPYLIGMSLGWILYKTDCKLRMSKAVVTVFWMLSTGGLLALVYGLYGADLHPIMAAAYSSLSHTAWALCLSWIVLACSTGYGGYINKVLSASILYPFSRVTYCAYLVHPAVIRLLSMRLDAPVHLEMQMITILFFGQLVLSYILAFIVSLMFESPIVAMLKLIRPKQRKDE